MPRLILGGLIAMILLGFFVYAVVVAVMTVRCAWQINCDAFIRPLTEGVVTVLNLVGGLVSALVVAELAITTPGQLPGGRLIANGVPMTGKTQSIATGLSIAFGGVWLVCGVAALVVGYMQHPDTVTELTTFAKSWLGLAVAAAYSYLGIRPNGGH